MRSAHFCRRCGRPHTQAMPRALMPWGVRCTTRYDDARGMPLPAVLLKPFAINLDITRIA
jgi:hypothetical protein